LAGGATAVDGCVLLCLEKLNQIIDIDHGNRIAVAQAGVLTGDLKRAAADVGLLYPPDPVSADFSTV
jgi:FAD/FMN-containing dehydrogenase